MERIKHNLKYIVPIFLLFIVGIITVYNSVYTESNDDIVKEDKKEEKTKDNVKNDSEFYYVDIKGEVNNPGVYKMSKDSRVIDVIESAGGLKENADTSIINLGKKVFDEMFVIIYSKDEVQKYKSETSSTKEINKKIQESVIIIDSNNDAQIKIEKENTEDKEEKININTADKDKLQQITGIGESKAKAIVKYREENGDFETIEDIKNVSGIGDSLFEKIKEFITV